MNKEITLGELKDLAALIEAIRVLTEKANGIAKAYGLPKMPPFFKAVDYEVERLMHRAKRKSKPVTIDPRLAEGKTDAELGGYIRSLMKSNI